MNFKFIQYHLFILDSYRYYDVTVKVSFTIDDYIRANVNLNGDTMCDKRCHLCKTLVGGKADVCQGYM